MYNEQALKEAYASGGSSGMWDSFMSTNKNAKRSSSGGWQSVQRGTAPDNIKEYKALLATLDNERRSGSKSKPQPNPAPAQKPKPAPKPTPTPPSSGGGNDKKRMSGSEKFQKELNEATKKYRPDPVDFSKYEDSTPAPQPKPKATTKPAPRVPSQSAPQPKPRVPSQPASQTIPQYEPQKDFVQGLKNEQAIKETDPFGDSWNNIDFFGKHVTMGREAQKGRGDASGIANKYIFNGAQTNPVDIVALDKHIRTNPLYSDARADLANLKTFGDTYANNKTPKNWNQPQAPSAYKAPDFSNMYSKYTKDIKDISI